MESYLLDWANLLLRWVHVITAIAWIGSSFYFVFLDNNLLKPTSADLIAKGVDGAMWAVHGGGFYNPQKYMVAPPVIHSKLHWFYWESYSTWLSGFALFTLMYVYNAGTYLIDKAVMQWGEPVDAAGVAILFLVGFWLIYDLACRSLGLRKNAEAVIGALMLVVVALAAWLACQLFSGRAAFLLIGAMIATTMSANVFFWIIPGQRKVVAAMTSGAAYDPQALAIHGQRGKQRSVHNTYFTLPVLFAMLSNHYSFTYAHQYNWLVLVLMMLGGALIRQFFVMRHGYKLGRNRNPVFYAVAGVSLILVVMLWMAPSTQPGPPVQTGPAATSPAAAAVGGSGDGSSGVVKIVAQRCVTCHGESVQQKNVRLDSSAQIERFSQQIYQQVVAARLMPLGNATGMTEEERVAIKEWYESKH